MSWVRVVAGSAGVLLAYYSAPVRWADNRPGLTMLLTILGVGVLAWAIVGQVRRQLAGEREVALPTLLTIIMTVVALFAWGYFALETAHPGQMAGLRTRTDSLYFTFQVLTTVGLGDVHAVGQAGRALVTAQMVFDLVFIAAAGSVLATSLRSHLVRASPPPRTPTEDDREPG